MSSDRVSMQLALAGELGPVLRTALTTPTVGRARRRTVLRISAPPDVDVLAVMQACDQEGLQVTSVRCVVGDARGRRANAEADADAPSFEPGPGGARAVAGS